MCCPIFSLAVTANLIASLFVCASVFCCFFNADLPVASPLCHAVLKTLQRWEQVLQKRLELFGGPPSKYISTHLQDEAATPGPALLRHKALFEPSNTPFGYRPSLFRLISYSCTPVYLHGFSFFSVFSDRRSSRVIISRVVKDKIY